MLFLTFGIMPHFYQYYLCILKSGYLNGTGVFGVGGWGGWHTLSLFTFPHLHTMIVYFRDSEHIRWHTRANGDTQRYRPPRPPSFPSTSSDGTTTATERAVGAPPAVRRGAGFENARKGDGRLGLYGVGVACRAGLVGRSGPGLVGEAERCGCRAEDERILGVAERDGTIVHVRPSSSLSLSASRDG